MVYKIECTQDEILILTKVISEQYSIAFKTWIYSSQKDKRLNKWYKLFPKNIKCNMKKQMKEQWDYTNRLLDILHKLQDIAI